MPFCIYINKSIGCLLSTHTPNLFNNIGLPRRLCALPLSGSRINQPIYRVITFLRVSRTTPCDSPIINSATPLSSAHTLFDLFRCGQSQFWHHHRQQTQQHDTIILFCFVASEQWQTPPDLLLQYDTQAVLVKFRRNFYNV